MHRLFGNKGAMIIVLLILLLIEFYCFTAVRTITKNLAPTTKTIIYIVYWILVIAGWVLLINFRAFDAAKNPIYGKFISPFVIGMVVAKLIVFTIMLIGDIYRFGKFVYTKTITPKDVVTTENNSTKIPRSEFLSAMALIGGGLAMGSFFYGTSNKYNYKIKKKKLIYPNLPEAFNGFKVVQFSDVHSGSFDSKEGVAKGVQMILNQQPDLILFTGDLVNNTQDEIIPYKDVFDKLKAPYGVYSVLGNHDYGDYVKWDTEADQQKNIQQLIQHQKDMGWEMLMNEHRILEKDGSAIALVGIENWGNRAGFPKYGDMKKATQDIPQDIPFKILMSHDPSHFDGEVQVKYKDIDLMLSGHTHGMQFGVKLPWMQWSPVQYVYKHWDGLYEFDKQKLYVNPGYGFIGYKGRVGILPEITVFELYNA